MATGRYTPVPPSVKDELLVHGQFQHKQHGFKLTVYALETGKYLRHPLGRLSGITQLLVDDLASLLPAVVLVYEHEWAALGGDVTAQRDHINQLLHQAEAAMAAQGQGQSGTGGAGSGKPAPVIIGLMPQGHPAQPQADTPDTAQVESADSTAVTTPEPPAPKLTPAEVQARLKELDQKQQTFFQGLPTLPSPALSRVKSPAQQQPLRPPQAPVLKPPRRPGA
jgi:hypothetical protein